MKKKYFKPEMNTKAYAQFENVFALCTNQNDSDKNPLGQKCYVIDCTRARTSCIEDWLSCFNNQHS